jgi:anti-sigma B factor antagonist
VTDALGIQRTRVGAAVVVEATGEVDMATAPALEREIEQACAEIRPPAPIVVDLTGVSFLGSAGLTVLVQAERRCRAHGHTLRVAAQHRAVLRTITLTGLDQVLDIHPSVPQAVRTTAGNGLSEDGGQRGMPLGHGG